MAKTTIADLSAVCSVMNERVETARGQLAALQVENQALSGRVAESDRTAAVLAEQLVQTRRYLDEAREAGRAQERVNADLRQEDALLRQRLDDHLKRVETSDNRRWALIGLMIGAVLSFVANLIVAWVRK